MMRANQGPKNRRFEWGHGRPFLQQFSDWLRTARRKDYRSRQRIPHMGLEPLEERQLLAAWPMTHGDIGNTGRAEFVIPADRLNDSFFDVFAWQTRTPGSPSEGNVDSTSMAFYDGVGP